jgi:hypothetical protein
MAHNRYLDNALIYSTIRLYIFLLPYGKLQAWQQ